MSTVNRLIQGIKKKFASEVQENRLLNEAQKTIMDYFETLQKEIETEISQTDSVSLEIGGMFNFIDFIIGDTGIEFERTKKTIEVTTTYKKNKSVNDRISFDEAGEVVYEEDDTSFVDQIYINEAGKVVTRKYPEMSFSVDHIDSYKEVPFS